MLKYHIVKTHDHTKYKITCYLLPIQEENSKFIAKCVDVNSRPTLI